MKDNTASTELTERLAALGRHPVDPATASQHLTAMAGVSLGRTGLRQKLQVAGALMAGIFIGGTGLATAGALGEAPEKAAEQAIAKVTFDRVKGDAIKADKVAKAADKAAEKAAKDADETGEGGDCRRGQDVKEAVALAREAHTDTSAGNQGKAVSAAAQTVPKCSETTPASPATGTETAEEAKSKSENSGQGADKSGDARAKADAAPTADRPAGPVDEVEDEQVEDDEETDDSARGNSSGKGAGTGRVELPKKP